MTGTEQRVKIRVMNRYTGGTLYTTEVPAPDAQRFLDLHDRQATKVEIVHPIAGGNQ